MFLVIWLRTNVCMPGKIVGEEDENVEIKCFNFLILFKIDLKFISNPLVYFLINLYFSTS